MSAGLLCVHPNYGGLVDTSGGLNFMYQWENNQSVHANTFYSALDHAIETVLQEDTQNYLKLVKVYADTRFAWNRIAPQWEGLLRLLKEKYPTVESRKVQSPMFRYRTG
jgi:hypothetical protein